MDLQGELVGLAAAVVGALLILLVTPFGHRLRAVASRRLPGSGIAVHVETDPTATGLPLVLFAGRFYFPGRAPTPDIPPEDVESRWRWAHAKGGLDVDTTGALVTLQALEECTVAIDPPRFRYERINLPDGAVVDWGGGGMGVPVIPRVFSISLDGHDRSVVYSDPFSKDARAPSFTMAKGDTERLLLRVFVDKGAFRWHAEVPLICNGRRETLTITDGGRPFTTVGRRGRPVLSLEWGSGWVLRDPVPDE